MAVYAQRHPATGEQLGRRPGQYVTWQEHFERLLAAEPHATAERRLELEVRRTAWPVSPRRTPT